LALLILSGPPLGGISKNQAVQIAWRYAGTGGDVKLGVARAGHFSQFKGRTTDQRVSGDPWVWAVSFTGRWTGSCSVPLDPGQNTCNPPNTSALVVLDYRSGTFILEEIPSPIE
jgi:hypothetical protein